jgi:hypothetical protein
VSLRSPNALATLLALMPPTVPRWLPAALGRVAGVGHATGLCVLALQHPGNLLLCIANTQTYTTCPFHSQYTRPNTSAVKPARGVEQAHQ